MKLSARNQFKGKVIEVDEGAVSARVVVDIGDGKKMTSTISMAALKDLKIKVGSEVYTFVKASSVILGIDD